MDTPTTHFLTSTVQRAAQGLKRWARDDSGVTAIEYGLIAAVLVLSLLPMFTTFGTALADLYEYWVAAAVAAIASSL